MKPIIQKFWMLIMMLCASISSFAYDFEVDGFYYEVNLEKMTATLVGGENKQAGEIVIPASVSYKDRVFSVTSINGAFRDNSELTGVKLPNSVVSLGDEAFKGCSSLRSISGLDSISELGISCFAGCTDLSTIALPEGLKKIESKAFSGCTGLVQILIPESVYSIGQAAFSTCTSLNTVVLPRRLESLSGNLFDGCIALKDIEIPSNVTAIGSGAFSGCKSLTCITIPSEVRTIGNDTFNGCSKLSNVIFSDGASILNVGTKESEYPLFADCPLTSVYIGRNLKYPSNSKGTRYYSPLEGAQLQDVKFGENVTYLYFTLFEDCNQLTTISLPNNIQTIYKGVFLGCNSISKLIVEDGTEPLHFSTDGMNLTLEPAGMYFMNDCQLDDIYIGRNITGKRYNPRVVDGYSVLYLQTSLRNIFIGDFVSDISCLLYDSKGKITKTLGRYTNLESLRVGARLPFVPDLSDNSKLCSLSLTSTSPQIASGFNNSQYMDLNPDIPIGSKEEYAKAPIWENFWDFNEQADLLTLFEIDGVWYHVLTGTTVEVTSFNNSYVGDIIIPEKVEYHSSRFDVVSIGNTFSKNSNITSIILPNTIKNLSKGCFQDCTKLSSITLGNGILNIPDECFKNCLCLSTFVLPDKLETIGLNAFEGCKSLNNVSFPDGIKRIETGAFMDCDGFSEISLPAHLNYIGTSVFRGCSNLKLVNWSPNILSINDYTFEYCTKLHVINSINHIIKIGRNAFANCSSLESISLGDEILTIGNSAFANCSSLESINLGNGNLTIGNSAFANSGIKNFVVTKSVEYIGSDAFKNCKSLNTLTFVESDHPIVLGCNSKEHLSNTLRPFPNASTVDEERASIRNGYYDGLFYGLPIEHLVINRDIELPTYYERTITYGSGDLVIFNDMIYYSPFYGLTNLKSVEIGENVSAICQNQIEAVVNAQPVTMDYKNFGGCNNIVVVTSKNPTAPIGGGFSQTVYENATLFLPNGGETSYKNDVYWKNFSNMSETQFIPIESISFDNEEIVLYHDESAILQPVIYPQNASIKKLKWREPSDLIKFYVTEDGTIITTSNPYPFETTINVTSCDGTGKTASIKVLLNKSSGIFGTHGDTKFDIQIADGKLHVIGKSESDIIEIFNTQGQLILSTKDNIIDLNTKGVYIVKVSTFSKKVIL